MAKFRMYITNPLDEPLASYDADDFLSFIWDEDGSTILQSDPGNWKHVELAARQLAKALRQSSEGAVSNLGKDLLKVLDNQEVAFVALAPRED